MQPFEVEIKNESIVPKSDFRFLMKLNSEKLKQRRQLPLSGKFPFSEFEISQVSETLLRACPS